MYLDRETKQEKPTKDEYTNYRKVPAGQHVARTFLLQKERANHKQGWIEIVIS